MSSAHVGLQQQRVVVGLQRSQLGDVLGGFPIRHPRIVEASGHQHGRIVAGLELVVGRVGADQLERGLVLDRVPPLRPFDGRERQRRVQHRVQDVHERHVRRDGPPQLRCLVHHRAHEFSAGAAAGDGDAPGRGVLLIDQMPRHVHEVVEGVVAPVELAGFVPVVAKLVAAPNVGDGEREAAIQERNPRGGERRHGGAAVRAVAIQIERRFAVLPQALAVDDGDGNRDAIPGRRVQPFGDVVRRIVAARNPPHLAAVQRVFVQGVVEHRVRRDHRLVVQAHRARRELLVAAQAHGVGRLGELDMGTAAVAVQNADMVHAVDAFLDREEIPKRLEAEDVAFVRRRDEFLPVGRHRIALRRDGQTRVLVRVVGADDESVALVIDRVFVSRLPRRNDHGSALRIGRRHQAHFGCNVVRSGDDDVLAGGRERDAGEKARIVFLIDHRVRVGLRRVLIAQRVQADLIGPPLVVEQRVEERRIVRRPHRIALGVLDDVRQQFSGLQILDAQRETFAAARIRAVGEQTPVVGNRERAKAKVVVAFRKRRFVENHLGLGGRAVARAVAVRWPTRPDAVLLVLLEAPLVVEGAVLHRHVGVLGRLAGFDFREQFLHQALARRHPRLEVGVLFLQIRQHVGVVHGRIAVVLQPAVRIVHRVAVQREGVRARLRRRRFGKGVGRHVGYRRPARRKARDADEGKRRRPALGGAHGAACVNRAAPARAWR